MLKKKCKNCNEKISKNHKFCGFCGAPQKQGRQEDWGMLGKEDAEEFTRTLPGIFNSGILNKMIGSAIKMIEKEMQKDLSKENIPNSNIRLMVNGKEIGIDEDDSQKKEIRKRIINQLSNKNLEKFSKLEKKEPKTNIKRFSDKIIYEINLPKVKSIKDISIVNLENSIEVKAISKEAAYWKVIPVGLQVKDYSLEKGKLILELENN